MRKKATYNDQRKFEEVLESLPKLNTSYGRSKEEVWGELSQRMEAMPAGRLRGRHLIGIRMASAAVVVILLGAALFARLFSTTITTPPGSHLTQLLPDGSVVEMNAGSVMRYKPMWWVVEREVIFEGEAFFKVKKGSSFRVESGLGQVTVLGTRFNVYARHNQYRVTCFSGKVRVLAATSGHSVDITANDQASLNRDGTIRLSHLPNPGETLKWMDNEFYFTATPLQVVFNEIERQYGIRIAAKNIPDYLYTGNFSGNRSVEEVLEMVCKPYGLDFYPVKNGFVIEKK